jgi:hypothetical protein
LPAAFVATLLAQTRSFKLCISAYSCQNSSDDFPDTKGDGFLDTTGTRYAGAPAQMAPFRH